MNTFQSARLFAWGWIVACACLAGCGATVAPTGDSGADVARDGSMVTDVVGDVPGCMLPNGQFCAAGTSCPAGDGCNTCSCPRGGGSAACTEIACPPIDAGGVSCASQADCTRGQSCVFSVGACAARGTCAFSETCLIPETFCSCSGTTYQSCQPTQPTRARGACAILDGGIATCRNDGDCRAGAQECIFPEGACAAVGQCQAISDCAAIAPYCGCDGVTFSSCPGRPTRPNTGRGICETPIDAGVSCVGAHFGRGGGGCVGPDDSPRPPECCTGWNCDILHASVICASLPPTCSPGWTPTVLGACWGPCVPNANCAPIPCPDGRCPAGFSCRRATLTCASG